MRGFVINAVLVLWRQILSRWAPADYAHMMQLRKSRWMGTQIIQIGA